MKKQILLGIAAVLLAAVAAVGIGKAYAYFTTYVEAKGQRTIHLGDQTTIEEQYADWKKDVAISNSSDSAQAVWVRAQAFSGSEYGLKYESAGSGSAVWTDGGDGFWYYGIPVAPGAKTETLSVTITDKDGNPPKAEEGKSFNVVVVYETVPAVQDGESEDGQILYKDADWAAQIPGVQSDPNSGGSEEEPEQENDTNQDTGGEES